MSSGHMKMTDTVSLFGGRVPAHVELLYKHLKDLDRSTFRQILAGKIYISLLKMTVFYDCSFSSASLRGCRTRDCSCGLKECNVMPVDM